MTDRLMVKVNYTLDAQNNGKFNFNCYKKKNFANWTKHTEGMGKYLKNRKIAKNCLKAV